MKKFNIREWQVKQRSLNENVAVTPMFDETHEEFMTRCKNSGNDEDACMAMHGDHIFKEPTNEQGFDDRFKDAMSGAGFSDEEQDDIMSRDIGDGGSPFPGTDEVSNGYKAAAALKDELRYVTYKKLSQEEIDTFSKEMVLHFLDNTTAAAAAKIHFAKKGI